MTKNTEMGSFSGTGLATDVEWQTFWQKMTLPDKIQISLPVAKKKIIVISGPTGVGKTALSLIVAKAIGGEIISADSMQVYKDMDIGTAKISAQEMDGIPHHLLNIRFIDQTFNVVDFWNEANQKIEEIYERGHVPIVVGGTGFYIHSLIYGPPTGPASQSEVRAQWENEMKEKGSEALFRKLEELDPQYAQTITQNDKHKIIRALEIISLTGKRVSQFIRQVTPLQKYDFRCWFLYLPKEILYKKIEERCDKMIEDGLLKEVKFLEKLGLRHNSSASQAIGYRQGLEFIDSPQEEEDLKRFKATFKQASRKYAKRQFTWFRKEGCFRWLNREEISFERAAEVILQDFELSL
ncbi:MAG: tRNA (adenosine(37)-N6)-dimethylallyltransferase MiaA [Verrucomicrobia bacterium]|nr:tRNA (adenosine(37)-N6)-dimethylallyltransferase MiaA [Verrucomicrobiota bacterium]